MIYEKFYEREFQKRYKNQKKVGLKKNNGEKKKRLNLEKGKGKSNLVNKLQFHNQGQLSWKILSIKKPRSNNASRLYLED